MGPMEKPNLQILSTVHEDEPQVNGIDQIFNKIVETNFPN